jgi:hypothetical protein
MAPLKRPGNNPHSPFNAPMIPPAIRSIKGLSTSTPVGNFETISKLMARTTTEIRKGTIGQSPQVDGIAENNVIEKRENLKQKFQAFSISSILRMCITQETGVNCKTSECLGLRLHFIAIAQLALKR